MVNCQSFDLKKAPIIFLTLLISCFTGLSGKAQTGSLELIENRGQWDTTIRFRADLPDATFFLQKHGFSVLLQSPSDMDALRQFMHGNQPATSPDNNPALVPDAKTTGNRPSTSQKNSRENAGPGKTTPLPDAGLTMHSHFYTVEFLNSSEEVEIRGDKAMDTYNNYFIGNDSSKWKSN
jgi:hypothetical protein